MQHTQGDAEEAKRWFERPIGTVGRYVLTAWLTIAVLLLIWSFARPMGPAEKRAALVANRYMPL